MSKNGKTLFLFLFWVKTVMRSRIVFKRKADNIVGYVNGVDTVWIKASKYRLIRAFPDAKVACLVVKHRDTKQDVAYIWLDSGTIHMV